MDCLLIADFSWLSPSSWWAIARVAIGLGFVIFVHELGHFLVAKACGVKCEKFYVGFDFFDVKIGDLILIPRSLVKWQWGETEYGIGILPLGGYVKMLGQDDNPGNIEQEIERSTVSTESADQLAKTGIPDRGKMDPRSFLAKSVPQRMAIISAGVIFNLIFAVIFAAIAFKSGVEYSPPIVGEVTPGGPAWESNLYGATITKVGSTDVYGYYQFVDLAQAIALNAGKEPIDLEFTMPGETNTKGVSVMPRAGMNEMTDLPLIGIRPMTIPRIAGDPAETIPGHPAASATPAFKDMDLIVGIEGEKVENSFDLRRLLAKHFDKAVTMEVSRENEGAESTLEVQVGANSRRESGLVMKWGPVKSIQNNSPAQTAGFEIGDEILSVDNGPVGDLFTLEQRMATAARTGNTISFKVKRAGNEIDLPVNPRQPQHFSGQQSFQPIAINSLGLAIQSSRIVAESNMQGIQAGDEITKIEFPLEDAIEKEQFEKRITTNEIELSDDRAGWEMVDPILQTLPAEFNFTISAKRGSELITASSQTIASTQHFLPTRGVGLTLYEETYQSPDWSDAIKQGAHQTYWDASRVFRFLTKLVSGQISPKNLGGPGLIAVAATSEATQGTPRLLLFLTLLSANLAIVNFLPIPVLDGGHMLFLAYEGLFRQPPNEKIQIILTYAGLFMILGLMLYVILLDITRIANWL